MRDLDESAGVASTRQVAAVAVSQRPKPSGKKVKRLGSADSADDSQGHYLGAVGDVIDGRCESCACARSPAMCLARLFVAVGSVALHPLVAWSVAGKAIYRG